MHENDRMGADALLGQRLLRELGCGNWSEVKARAQAASDEVFPRLFSVVASLADWVEFSSWDLPRSHRRRDILRAAAFDLAMLAENLAERLKLRGDKFFLAKTGGMIGRCKFFETELDERLRISFPQAEIGALQISPAEAAARLALRLLTPGGRTGANVTGGNRGGTEMAGARQKSRSRARRFRRGAGGFTPPYRRGGSAGAA